MKTAILTLIIGYSLTALSPLIAAESRLNQDPKVVYLENFSKKPLILLTVEKTPIHVSKTGGRRIGYIEEGTKVELLAMDDKAYRIKGAGRNGKIVGWTAPRYLASQDPKFVGNLKKLYERQMLVQELIEKGEVAIGMSLDEVEQVLGKPTKTKVRTTATGKSGTYEYITYEEQEHYAYVRNQQTGQLFRQLTHVTQEETGKISLEFEGDAITAIEESEDQGGGKVRIITPPIWFF